VYNLSYNRPRVDGIDDETGEPLTKRPDDNPVRYGGVLITMVISEGRLVARKFLPAACGNFIHQLRHFSNIIAPTPIQSHVPKDQKQNLFP
jgi:hypothetical protein